MIAMGKCLSKLGMDVTLLFAEPTALKGTKIFAAHIENEAINEYSFLATPGAGGNCKGSR